ncbi:retrovirus-related pol polyprotein from transposon TNT 1-94 [Tanacetum coccineum]
MASRFPSTSNQLRTTSNPGNQATIQDGMVRNNAAGQGKVIKCYNCQGEGHMARQCTRLKRPRNSAWFQEKLLLTEDLDAYNSDCGDISSAKVILIANLLSCNSDVLSEVYGIWQGSVLVQNDQGILHGFKKSCCSFKPKRMVRFWMRKGEGHIATIPQNVAFQTEDLDAYNSDCGDISSAKAILIANLLSCNSDVLSKYQSMQTLHMITTPQVYYDNTYKQALGYQNPFYLKKAQRIRPTLYDGNVISIQHVVVLVIDDEETLILEEES